MEGLQTEAPRFFPRPRKCQNPTHDDSEMTFQNESYVTGSKGKLASWNRSERLLEIKMKSKTA